MTTGRQLATILLLAALRSEARAEVVLFEESFGTPTAGTYCDPEFPSDWVRHDVDGQTPADSVSWVNDAWVSGVDDFDGTNCAAVSTSWYDPPSTSNDWLVTPLIHVPGDSTLSWRAYAPFAGIGYADDYEVLVSFSGTAPGDFTLLPPAIVDENGTWTARAIDLDTAGVAGRAVHFAFRNVSDDDYLLYVDDVKVAVDNALLREEFGGVDGNGKCAPQFPAGWERVDDDGRTPEAEVSFVDQAWVPRNEDWSALSLAECVAISTSFYQQQGQADDWLITPAIQIPQAADLSWRAIADDADFRDGYEVLYSTGGTNPAEFTAHAALFSVAAENADWTARTIDLDAAGLGGQSIRLAFRNHSDDQFLLLVDSIEISIPIVFRDGFESGYAGAWTAAVGFAP